MLPEISRQAEVHNPFPQLSKVAVAPFFNLTTEATVDGRQFALAYFNELQSIPGFEVVPVGVVEKAIEEAGIALDGPDDARKLAQLLHVDAVVIGAITEFSPYYPPRCALQVEWYSANPNFHPIPPGYGLPWGTPAESQIPDRLIFEAEMALAKEQLATQSPDFEPIPVEIPPAELPADELSNEPGDATTSLPNRKVMRAAHHASEKAELGQPASIVTGDTTGIASQNLPVEWPDPAGFTPPPPSPVRPLGVESKLPVLQHTRIYHANDSDFTQALESYVYFRDDARMGGWQSYLQRSEDFIRFCCHLHIAELLTARGGGGPGRVVMRWPVSR